MALENLRQVYDKEKSEEEIQMLAKENFVHLCEFAAEWFYMPKMAKNPGRYLGIQGVEKLHESLRQKKGVMLLVSHKGNWEVMALIAGLFIAQPIKGEIYALARPLKNPLLYEYVLNQRGLTGLKSISKIGAVGQTFRRLKQNGSVCLLIDQRVNEGAVEVEFFRRKALTTSLPAICGLRFGTPIYYLFCDRTRERKYIMKVEGPAAIKISGRNEEDIRVNTQSFNDRVEAEIRKDPSQWLWMHNRWRIRHGPK